LRSVSHVGRTATCALGLLLTACPGFIPPQPSGEPRTAVGAIEREQITNRLAQRIEEGSERASLRGYARVRIDSEAGKARVREVIAAERPARLRVETLNFLGQAQSLLVADGDEASFYDGREVVRGEQPAVLLRRLGLDLEPADAIDLLLAAPRLPEAEPSDVWAVGDERIVEFERRRVRLSEQGELRRVDALDARGLVRWSVEFDAWSEVPGGRYPMVIRAYFPRTDLRAEFEFEEVQLNTPLDTSLFRVPRSPE